MRPASIRYFDWAMLAMLACTLLNLVLLWGSWQRAISVGALSPLYAYGTVSASAALYFALWFFVSGRASNVARWILAVLTVFNVLGLLFRLVQRQVPPTVGGLLSALSLAALATAVWMLFRRDAKDWFAGRASVDPEIFR